MVPTRVAFLATVVLCFGLSIASLIPPPVTTPAPQKVIIVEVDRMPPQPVRVVPQPIMVQEQVIQVARQPQIVVQPQPRPQQVIVEEVIYAKPRPQQVIVEEGVYPKPPCSGCH